MLKQQNGPGAVGSCEDCSELVSRTRQMHTCAYIHTYMAFINTVFFQWKRVGTQFPHFPHTLFLSVFYIEFKRICKYECDNAFLNLKCVPGLFPGKRHCIHRSTYTHRPRLHEQAEIMLFKINTCIRKPT